MDLAAYVELDEKQHGPGGLTRLHLRTSKVSYNTIWMIHKEGHRLTDYHTAKRLSAATGGLVSIAELCEPEPKSKKKRARRRSRKESDAPGVS